MIWCYDNAIVDDLKNSFNTDDGHPVVSVVPPENIVTIAAQLEDDKISFPMLALSRSSTIDIDNNRTNFTAIHDGMPVVFDPKRNLFFNEKQIPVKLSYNLVCLATNTADVDELIRELIFKYTQQYFLSFRIPYESKRKIRFGIQMAPNSSIEWYATTSDYLTSGSLHSAGITLNIDGAVMLSYTPIKLRRMSYEIDPNKVPQVDTIYYSSQSNISNSISGE